MSLHQTFTTFSESVFDEAQGIGFPNRLLEPLVSELEFSLTGIALTGSIVNGITLHRAIQEQFSAVTFLPPEPLLWSSSLLGLYGDEFSNLFGDNLIELEISLFKARKSTVDTFAATIRGSSTFALDWRPASELWRTTAREARLAYKSGLLLASDFIEDDFAPVLDALSAVEAGQCPLVTSAGAIVVPSTGERRLTRRKTIDQQAQLFIGNSQHRIVLRDISVTGMGLGDCPNLARGTKVSVKLRNGRLLAGIVVWSQNGRTGVRLSEALSQNDAILSRSNPI